MWRLYAGGTRIIRDVSHIGDLSYYEEGDDD
jgi:hypothetical protein